MSFPQKTMHSRALLLAPVVAGGLLLAVALLAVLGQTGARVQAAPIEPPEGYPKFILSTKTVTPSLVTSGGETLTYVIEIVNTGGYTASAVTLVDPLSPNVTYNNDAIASAGPAPTFANNTLTWTGAVGFDDSVRITFSVDVAPAYQGVLTNTAEIHHASLAEPLLLPSEAMVTDDPLLRIEKSASPALPGPNKELTFTLTVLNAGQPAAALPVVVTDKLPSNTSFLRVGPDGAYNPGAKTVTWNRDVSLATGEASEFVFTVKTGDVPSGTVIANDTYQVAYLGGEISTGEPYTTTVVDPVLFLYKETDPFPPGSNRDMVYNLTVFNKGSLATDLVIEDTIPEGVTYVSGGTRSGGIVRWTLPSLDTGASATVSYTVHIGDIAEVPVLNDTYEVCSAEGVCQAGIPLTSVVKGATFEAYAELDPVAKKPGGGGGPVTPTLSIRNLGPGYALDATAMLYFYNISISNPGDIERIPNVGTLASGPECGDKCRAYKWTGDIGYGEAITFTVYEPQSTIGGEEGNLYTATIGVSDASGAFTSEPITATATGRITHFANLIPSKSAPAVIGAGQTMTYNIQVYNSGLSTNDPPFPTLTDTVPASTTVVSISDGGVLSADGGMVSWTLPAMGPGDRYNRQYSVEVDPGLVSGTLIVNDDYRTAWWNTGISNTFVLSHTGEPITTVVKEVGLIDSFKEVDPISALPGEGNLLTYTVHVVNTSPVTLTGVRVHDLLPWQNSTYQRDASATSGKVISDIVSVDWTGSVGPLSEELITLRVLVDDGYEGPITNTAVIHHSSLQEDLTVEAVAYITDEPVLRITKQASPDPVRTGGELLYTIQVENLGQQASELVISDTIPAETSFVPYSASGNGQLVGDAVVWSHPVLPAGEKLVFTFRVKVGGVESITNSAYGVTSAEGITAYGDPVVTRVVGGPRIYLPVVRR